MKHKTSLIAAIVLVIVCTAVLCTLFNHALLTKMRPDVLPSLLFFNNWWQIFLLAVPVEILVILGFRIKKKPEKKKEAEPQVTEENK